VIIWGGILAMVIGLKLCYLTGDLETGLPN
jgi:hypothetical protein